MNADKLKGCLAAFWGALATIVFIAIVAALAIYSAGCMGNKASHQSGVVLYADTRGRFGVGYGETEDMPQGCIYFRHVFQQSPAAFWQGSGTNITCTMTFWDTRCMTNSIPSQALPTARTDGDPQPPAEN